MRNSINEYKQHELVDLVRWIQSDGRLLTDDEIVQELVKELGFAGRGSQIDAAIRRAIGRVRSISGRA